MASRQLTLFGSVASEPEPKRKKTIETSRKENEVFKENWKKTAVWPRVEGVDLPEDIELSSTWLEYREGLGMFCKLCTKYGKLPRSGLPVWTKEPCILLRHESVTRHMNSSMHEDAERAEKQYQLSLVDGGIACAFEKQWEAEESAVKAAFACVYFLAQEEIPHTTNYEPLMSLLSHLGLPHLQVLNKGGNANYTSYRIVDELLVLLGQEVKRLVQRKVEQSPFVGIICDETTDLSTSKALVLYAKTVVKGEVCTFFLGVNELTDGCAESVKASIMDMISTYGLSMERVAAMGSDGAAVMVGKENGVAAKLIKEQPSLINIHCVAHRLALAVLEAAETVSEVKRFKGYVKGLYTYFHRSANRTAHLKATFEDVFDRPALKLREPADTRWLACDEAVQVIRRCLDPLSTALNDLACNDDGDATALGLAGLFKKYSFIAAVFFMSEVLPILSWLSKVFQTENLPFSAVSPAVQRADATLKGIKTCSQHGTADWQKELAVWEENHPELSTGRNNDHDYFLKGFAIPYIEALLQNLAERFPEESLAILKAADVFNPENSPRKAEDYYHYGRSQIVCLAEHYKVESTIALVEWKEAVTSLKNFNTTHDFLLYFVKTRSLYPALGEIACRILVIPMHSADCERGFSAMGRIKSRLRTRMVNKTLNCLLRISIEGPKLKEFDFDKLLEQWARARNRRLFQGKPAGAMKISLGTQTH